MVDFYGRKISFLKLFGQQRWGECSPGRIIGKKIFHAAGLAIDRRAGREHIYVPDTGNNRILGFRNYDSAAPELILGQQGVNLGAPNGDCNLGSFGAPTRRTLCLLDTPGNPNLAEQWQRLDLAVSPAGDLYVPDVHNNRVLVYADPFRAAHHLPSFVIGQDDFSSNAINRGRATCDERSLFLTFDGAHVASHGVSVDAARNVWVADPGNHRVLRFPRGSQSADLVLGQPNFNERVANEDRQNLARMCRPTLARVDSSTGKLYVLDEFSGFTGRVLVFTPPFSNGMTPVELVPRFHDGAVMEPIYRAGFSFNPFKTDDPTMVEGRRYREGILWLNDRWRTMLLAADGLVLVSIAQITVSGKEGQFINFEEDFNLTWPGGSPAFDSANNIYVADGWFHRIARYRLPYYPEIGPDGQLHPPPTNGGLFPGLLPNSTGNANFSGSGIGAIAYGNQLIVRDFSRYMVWENYTDVTADGPPPTFILSVPHAGLSRSMHAIDRARARLWTTTVHGELMFFGLPMTPTSTPTMPALLWESDGTPVDYRCAQTLAYDDRSEHLWIFDNLHFRLLRLRQDGTRFVVDAIIGQNNRTDGAINRGMSAPDASSLGMVNDIRFDGKGNLFVVDNTYECHENQRVIVFLNDDLEAIRGIPTDIQAKRVFVADSFTKPQTCGADVPAFIDKPSSPVCVAFNSRNEMVLGNDGYYSDRRKRHLTQLYLYRTPFSKQTPDAVIELPLGAPGEISFDAEDNLIVQDHIWSKLWVINIDRDPAWLRWL